LASKDKVFYSKNTLNVNGNLIDLSSPKIMGILNVTSDSFYDGGKFLKEKEICFHVEKMLYEGADIIDVGGYSSRPGAKDIDEKLETDRVLTGIRSIKTVAEKTPISVDTFRSNVARKSIEEGAGIINDISGGNLDFNMNRVILENKVPYVLMHMVGSPQNMANHVSYENILIEIVNFFSKKLKELTHFGIKDVIIDVGFGFSKTTAQNYALLKNLKCFQMLNAPLLVGISRKSMIYKVLETSPEMAINGTSALHAFSLLKGANILRVHDVKEAKEVINLINLLKT
jgi:dihydropteroate synthase